MKNIMYLTSLRELAKERADEPISSSSGKSLGLRKSLFREISDSAHACSTEFKLVAIICDDEAPELTYSSFLDVPIEYVSSKRYLMAKCVGKENVAYERRVFESLLLRSIANHAPDVIVCDSFMVILSIQFLNAVKCPILNVHPGIIDSTDAGEAVGMHPTRDVYTRSQFGWRIVDDHPFLASSFVGNIEVMWKGKLRRAVQTGCFGRSGVSVHHLAASVDSGLTVAAAVYNFAAGTMTEEEIRHTNYRLKWPVLRTALSTGAFTGATDMGCSIAPASSSSHVHQLSG